MVVWPKNIWSRWGGVRGAGRQLKPDSAGGQPWSGRGQRGAVAQRAAAEDAPGDDEPAEGEQMRGSQRQRWLGVLMRCKLGY